VQPIIRIKLVPVTVVNAVNLLGVYIHEFAICKIVVAAFCGGKLPSSTKNLLIEFNIKSILFCSNTSLVIALENASRKASCSIPIFADNGYLVLKNQSVVKALKSCSSR